MGPILILLLLLILPAWAWGAIAHVQTIAVSGAGVTSATTGDLTTTNGNLIVCPIIYFTFNVFTSITDSKSNTYVDIFGELTSSASANSHMRQQYVNNITGGGTHNFTATFSGNSSFDLICSEISGQATSGVLDKTASKIDNSGTSHTSSSTATTDQTNELLVGSGGLGDGSSTYAVGGSFTERSNITGSPGVSMGSIVGTLVVAGTAAYDFPFTTGTSSSGIIGAISTWRELVVAPTVRRRAPMVLQ